MHGRVFLAGLFFLISQSSFSQSAAVQVPDASKFQPEKVMQLYQQGKLKADNPLVQQAQNYFLRQNQGAQSNLQNQQNCLSTLQSMIDGIPSLKKALGGAISNQTLTSTQEANQRAETPEATSSSPRGSSNSAKIKLLNDSDEKKACSLIRTGNTFDQDEEEKLEKEIKAEIEYLQAIEKLAASLPQVLGCIEKEADQLMNSQVTPLLQQASQLVSQLSGQYMQNRQTFEKASSEKDAIEKMKTKFLADIDIIENEIRGLESDLIQSGQQAAGSNSDKKPPPKGINHLKREIQEIYKAKKAFEQEEIQALMFNERACLGDLTIVPQGQGANQPSPTSMFQSGSALDQIVDYLAYAQAATNEGEPVKKKTEEAWRKIKDQIARQLLSDPKVGAAKTSSELEEALVAAMGGSFGYGSISKVTTSTGTLTLPKFKASIRDAMRKEILVCKNKTKIQMNQARVSESGIYQKKAALETRYQDWGNSITNFSNQLRIYGQTLRGMMEGMPGIQAFNLNLPSLEKKCPTEADFRSASPNADAAINCLREKVSELKNVVEGTTGFRKLIPNQDSEIAKRLDPSKCRNLRSCFQNYLQVAQITTKQLQEQLSKQSSYILSERGKLETQIQQGISQASSQVGANLGALANAVSLLTKNGVKVKLPLIKKSPELKASEDKQRNGLYDSFGTPKLDPSKFEFSETEVDSEKLEERIEDLQAAESKLEGLTERCFRNTVEEVFSNQNFDASLYESCKALGCVEARSETLPKLADDLNAILLGIPNSQLLTMNPLSRNCSPPDTLRDQLINFCPEYRYVKSKTSSSLNGIESEVLREGKNLEAIYGSTVCDQVGVDVQDTVATRLQTRQDYVVSSYQVVGYSLGLRFGQVSAESCSELGSNMKKFQNQWPKFELKNSSRSSGEAID